MTCWEIIGYEPSVGAFTFTTSSTYLLSEEVYYLTTYFQLNFVKCHINCTEIKMIASSLINASNVTVKRAVRNCIPNGVNRFATTNTSSVTTEDLPFQNFRISPAEKTTKHEKFISPRKRANKIMTEITSASMQGMHNPKVHDVHFRVGDAIELHMVAQGGINSNQTEKIRGVVLGIDKRQLGTGIYLRDVVFGEPIDRKIPLYSPLIKSITVLEENFVFKKKRKVKRAKLYYLRDRLPQETRVTKW